VFCCIPAVRTVLWGKYIVIYQNYIFCIFYNIYRAFHIFCSGLLLFPMPVVTCVKTSWFHAHCHLDLECPPKAHVIKAWFPACVAIGTWNLLQGESLWEEVRSLRSVRAPSSFSLLPGSQDMNSPPVPCASARLQCCHRARATEPCGHGPKPLKS
jgi:hypothetical protein